jgi:hypothetical protein
MKIGRVGAEFVPCGPSDGRTVMTKLIVAFRIFAKAPTDVQKGQSFVYARKLRATVIQPKFTKLKLHTQISENISYIEFHHISTNSSAANCR